MINLIRVIPSPLRRGLGRGKYLIFKILNIQSIQTLHIKNNMTIKKVSSIAKLEDLGRIQLSTLFFMRD